MTATQNDLDSSTDRMEVPAGHELLDEGPDADARL
jgi:hypothetical protein